MSRQTLAKLNERRAFECRLRPERALESLDEAHGFLIDRGILTRTADSALPSLFGACHEEPYQAGGRGFALWPATKYPWFWELAQRDAVYELAIHRAKSVLLTAATAALADPMCRAELERREAAADDGAQLLRHLTSAGPSELEDLKLELGWSARRLRAARAPLERSGALVSHGLQLDAANRGHVHSSVLARWDHVFPVPSPSGGLDELVVAGLRAAVVAPEDELDRWFSWPDPGGGTLAERLFEGGRLVRPAPGWVASIEAPSS